MEPQEKEIDGTWFRVRQLGAKKHRKVFVRLLKILGVPFGEAAAAAPSVTAMSNASMMSVLRNVIATVDEADLDFLAEAFGSVSEYSTDGSRWLHMTGANQEQLFTGRMMLFLQWLYFAVEVNYSDFLSFVRSGGNDAALAENRTQD